MHYDCISKEYAPIYFVFGLPGSGKTKASEFIQKRIGGVHINADYVRETISTDLKFSTRDRITQARRMGAMAQMISEHGTTAIVDFVCPTLATRKAFRSMIKAPWNIHAICMNTIKKSRFSNTNAIWKNPVKKDKEGFVSFIEFGPWRGLEEFYQRIDEILCYKLDSRFYFSTDMSTAIIIGRFQGAFHEGHIYLIKEGFKRADQVLIYVRDTYDKNDEKNPEPFEVVKQRIRDYVWDHYPTWTNRLSIQRAPDITHVLYGRDVGYKVEQIAVPPEIAKISASEIRRQG